MRIGKRTFASRKRKIAGLCAFVLAGVIGVGAFAFTASNTIPAQAAGGGTNAVSGYTESGVSYTWSLSGEYITEAHVILTNAEKLEPSDVAVALSKLSSACVSSSRESSGGAGVAGHMSPPSGLATLTTALSIASRMARASAMAGASA